MYLIDKKRDQLIRCDCLFTDKKFVMERTRRLLASVTVKTYESSRKPLGGGNIYWPVYILSDGIHKEYEVTELSSKTPYLLAFLGYYMPHNWMWECQHGDVPTDAYKDAYWTEQIQKMRGAVTSQFSNIKYSNRDAFAVDSVFETLSKTKDPQAFALFLREYCPECVEFREIFPYVELNIVEQWKLEVAKSELVKEGEKNTQFLKQLKLKPNIRR